MRPVARCALIIALALSTPLDDWLMPCEKIVTVRSVRANIWKNSLTCASATPHTCATLGIELTARAASNVAAKPSTCASTKARSSASSRRR